MEPHIPTIQYRRRWFCYLDLLGFSQLVRSESIDRILPLYERALGHIEMASADRSRRGVFYSWFSDTFIMYSQGDTPEEFARVEQAGRLFFQELILARIAVRGALTCGDLYSQQERNIFIGEALIDAHAYGEGQDWLGFLLAPGAIARMREIGVPAEERAFYRVVPPEGVMKQQPTSPVYAFAFNNGEVNGKNPYLQALTAMQAIAPEVAVGKYVRSLAFLREHATLRRDRAPHAAA
jgi:hypothetical protein